MRSLGISALNYELCRKGILLTHDPESHGGSCTWRIRGAGGQMLSGILQGQVGGATPSIPLFLFQSLSLLCCTLLEQGKVSDTSLQMMCNSQSYLESKLQNRNLK